MENSAIIIIKDKFIKKFVYHEDGDPTTFGKKLCKFFNNYNNPWYVEDILYELCTYKAYDEYDAPYGNETYSYIIDCDNYTISCYKNKCNHLDLIDGKYNTGSIIFKNFFERVNKKFNRLIKTNRDENEDIDSDIEVKTLDKIIEEEAIKAHFCGWIPDAETEGLRQFNVFNYAYRLGMKHSENYPDVKE